MRVNTTIINGIEYSRDNSESVFLVPVSKLENFKASDLPNSSSLHPIEIDVKDLRLYFSVTHSNSPEDDKHYSIFICFEELTENYDEGRRKLHQIASAIAPIASQETFDNPEMNALRWDNGVWRHSLT